MSLPPITFSSFLLSGDSRVIKSSIRKHSPPFAGLTGPTYSLSGSVEKFKLPPPSSLQPGIENNPGKLDSWPVHSINPAKSDLSLGQSQTGSRHLQEHAVKRSSPTHNRESISIIPKPKFLEQLEAYLRKELHFLDCPPCGPHELRLQAHREVFEYLIEDFKTYKPLLSAIKNEYELFIESQQEMIKALEPLEVSSVSKILTVWN